MAPDDAKRSIDLDRSHSPLLESLHREEVSFDGARSSLVQLETGLSAYQKIFLAAKSNRERSIRIRCLED